MVCVYLVSFLFFGYSIWFILEKYWFLLLVFVILLVSIICVGFRYGYIIWVGF